MQFYDGFKKLSFFVGGWLAIWAGIFGVEMAAIQG